MEHRLLVESDPYPEFQVRRSKKCCSWSTCHRFLNTFLLLTIIGLIGAGAAYVIPQINQFKQLGSSLGSTNTNFNHSITRVNQVMDKIESIPQVDWDFITNPTYQSKLINMIKQILDHLPEILANLISHQH